MNRARVFDLLADMVLVSHFLFVLAAVAGAFAILADPRWALIHVPIVVWSSAVNLFSWTCPLTPIEKHFRRRAGGDAYTGDFIQHYLGGIVYPKGMPRRMEITAGVSIVGWNVLCYLGLAAWVWFA